jgi:glycine hydroxymethyltransferase
MHIIAAKAVCFREAAKPEFREYAKQIRRNATALASALLALGYKLSSGGTDNHLMLIDLRKSHPNLTGKEAQIALDQANITTNRNTVPGETRSPFQTSGLRLGTPAVTTRGMREPEMARIAEAIDTVLGGPTDPARIARAKDIALELSGRFPLPY